jgi:hypothetical protein
LVESVREDGKTKQRIIQNLGRNGIYPRPGEAVCSSVAAAVNAAR